MFKLIIFICLGSYINMERHNPASATDTYLSWFPSVSFFPEVTAIEIKYVSDGGLIIENPKFHVVEKSKNI